tara:strand:+ start:2574 stop:3014 length:441 start_codon:yes stop_codon:yes gene_type:complete
MAEKIEEVKAVETKEVEITVETENAETTEQIIFKKAFESLNEKLKDKDIDVGNVMLIVRYAMEIVETTQVKGEQQKDLAVKLIEKIVVDAPISDEKEKLLLDMLKEGVVASTIDLVVAASRGQLNINKVKEVAMTCWEFIKSKLKR